MTIGFNNRDEPEMVVAMAADGNWLAKLAHKGGRRTVYVPLTAWDDTGHGLIVDRKKGRLMRVTDDATFCGLVRRRPQDEDREAQEALVAADAPEGDDDE